MTNIPIPSLFGIKYSNRDFTKSNSWGKNQFNSSFPASLAAFLEYKQLENVYLKLGKNLLTYHDSIGTEELYGQSSLSDDIYYSFETSYLPFQQLVVGDCPRVDLVILNRLTNSCLKGIEIKLTALPDNSTCNLLDDRFGCELVIRPDTIVYLVCSIAIHFKNSLRYLKLLIGDEFDAIEDWTQGIDVYPMIPRMSVAIDRIILEVLDTQEPLVMQPIWKTKGKSPKLAENCLDIFIWSNLAFAQLFLNVARKEMKESRTINRQLRTVIWLFKMLYDFSLTGRIDHRKVIDELSYNTKNDKAFSINGSVTYPYMKCDILTKPRITEGQIKEIIRGGGQNLLSPERRFDAIIFNSPDLFI